MFYNLRLSYYPHVIWLAMQSLIALTHLHQLTQHQLQHTEIQEHFRYNNSKHFIQNFVLQTQPFLASQDGVALNLVVRYLLIVQGNSKFTPRERGFLLKI